MNYKKILSSMLLCGAAISGLVAGGHVDSYLYNVEDESIVISASDRYEEIKIILTSKINKSELLGESDKISLIDKVNSIELENDVLEVVKLIEKSEMITKIQSLELSESDIQFFIEEIENLDDANDIFEKAKQLELDLKNIETDEQEEVDPVEEVSEAIPADGEVDTTDVEDSNEPINISPIEKVEEPVLEVDEFVEETPQQIIEETDQETNNDVVDTVPTTDNVNEETVVDDSEENFILPSEDIVDEWISEESTEAINELEDVVETTTEPEVTTAENTDGVDGSYTLEVTATAYSRNQPELSNITATGIDLTQQTNVIAVDPNVIPLGSTVEIPGYGTFVAGDTGSAIVGNRIDVHMEDLSTAQSFGHQSMTVTISNADAPVVSPFIEEESEYVDEVEVAEEEDTQAEEIVEEAVEEVIEETTEEYVEETEVVSDYEEEVVVEEIDVDDYVEETEVVEEVVESSGRYDVGSIAAQYVGVPYVWGGSDPSGFDCSGLTSYTFAQVGIGLPRTSQAQSTMGQYVDLANVQPGDLIFWGGLGSAYHVGIYVGDGSYIHAPDVGSSVQYGSLSYSGASFARRL